MRRLSRISFINQCINIFWTGFAFTPVLWLWMKLEANNWLYIFLILSFVFSILPQRILNKFNLGRDRKIYERTGVKTIRKYVQDGDWVNSLSNKPTVYRFNDQKEIKKFVATITMYERYHWFAFIFFSSSAIYAFFLGLAILGIWITIANLIYNIASILLQQYNRIRIEELLMFTVNVRNSRRRQKNI